MNAMNEELEPIGAGHYQVPAPRPTTRVLRHFGSAPLINELNRYFWQILKERGYSPEEFKPWAPDRKRPSKGVVITPILIDFVEDASTVFALPVSILLDILGVHDGNFRTAQQKYRGTKQETNRAALTAAMARDPEIFEASVRLMKSSKGRLNLANAKLEELHHGRKQTYHGHGNMEQLLDSVADQSDQTGEL